MKILCSITKYGLAIGSIALLTTAISCKDSEVVQINTNFEAISSSVDEGDHVGVTVVLSKPATKDEFVTISVTNPTAVFGTDFGIDDLLFLTNDFTIVIPKDSLSASISFSALSDFEIESTEDVLFELDKVSDGLTIGDHSETTISIVDIENYPEDNRAILFDGVDDYIDLGNIYDNLGFPITISAWVWLDPTATSPSGSIALFDSQEGLPLYNGFSFVTSNTSNIGITYGDGQGENNIAFRRSKSSIFSPTNGRWVNYTGIIRGSNDMDLYFNGVDVGGSYAGESNLPMNSNSPNETAKVGLIRQNGLTLRFKGKIDELKIWNRSLSREEVQKVIFTKLDDTATGLIGYWDFDEPVGTTVLDKSANKFNGTLMGNPTRVSSEVPVN